MENKLIREHFKKDGTPKVKLELENAVALEADIEGVAAYRCDFCGWWHIGRSN